jgi:hypothetical protein
MTRMYSRQFFIARIDHFAFLHLMVDFESRP